ncbi:hypothetical protein FKP32DRAFT_1569450, partial [Trametes sanguinea]
MAVCRQCRGPFLAGRLPRLALANGRWLGACPVELQNLTYVEQMLIARNRHSFCVAQVAQGQRFMSANVVIFGQPVVKMYDILPPARKDIEECLAILFVGSAKPTNDDVSRTPFFVRHSVVMRALRWLVLNNPHYNNVIISDAHMAQYPEDEPPVGIIFRQKDDITGENLAVYQDDIEHAVSDGPCSFVVRGLYGDELVNMTYDEKVAHALRYFDGGNPALAYGHSKGPE